MEQKCVHEWTSSRAKARKVWRTKGAQNIQRGSIHQQDVEQVVEVPVPVTQEEFTHVHTIIPQDCIHQQHVGQVVEVPVPMTQEEITHVQTTIQQDCVQPQHVEQVVEVPVPMTQVKCTHAQAFVQQDCIHQQHVEQVVEVPVPMTHAGVMHEQTIIEVDTEMPVPKTKEETKVIVEVGDIVYFRDDDTPSIVVRVGVYSYRVEVRIRYLTEPSTYEAGRWVSQGGCHLLERGDTLIAKSDVVDATEARRVIPCGSRCRFRGYDADGDVLLQMSPEVHEGRVLTIFARDLVRMSLW